MMISYDKIRYRLDISKDIRIFVSRPSFGGAKRRQGAFHRWLFLLL